MEAQQIREYLQGKPQEFQEMFHQNLHQKLNPSNQQPQNSEQTLSNGSQEPTNQSQTLMQSTSQASSENMDNQEKSSFLGNIANKVKKTFKIKTKK